MFVVMWFILNWKYFCCKSNEEQGLKRHYLNNSYVNEEDCTHNYKNFSLCMYVLSADQCKKFNMKHKTCVFT